MRDFFVTGILLFFSCIAECSLEGITDVHQPETKGSKENYVQPYLDTDAEKWAFDLQMKRILTESQEKIQEKARSFILKRRQNHAQVPDETVPTSVNTESQDHLYKVHLGDGVITGLEGVIFSFDKILAYEDVDVVFAGEIKYPKGIEVIQSFIASTNDTIMGNGKTTTFADKLSFIIKARLNLKLGSIQLEHFENNCHSIVKVNFEGRGPMELPLIQTISKIAKELFTKGVLRDVQKLTQTAMEAAFEMMKGNMELPPYDYGKNYTHFDYVGLRFRPNVTRCSKKIKNPIIMRAAIRTSGVGVNYPENLPFIQNDPEMKSFFDLLRNGTHKYLNEVLEKTIRTLQLRGLKVAKLADRERTFISDGSSGADLVGNLKITNGWISGITEISRGGMDYVYINGTEILISARVHIPKEIEVNQAFHLDLGAYKGAGGLRGTTDYMIYLAKISVNLKTFETNLIDLFLVCIGEVKYQVAVIETNESKYEVGLVKAAVDSFNRSVSNEIGLLIRHSMEYAISKIDVKDYIPPWDYTRVCDRKVNLDPKYRMCGKADMALAMSKKHGNGPHTKVKSNPVHFINTELELQAFADELLISMDNYLKEMINEASRIITIQDLKKLRYKYYVRPWNAKDPEGMYKFGTISIFGGVLEDLSNMFQGKYVIDNLEFDDKSIVLSAQIPFWWILKFQANTSVIQDKKHVTTHVKGELNSLIYFVKIRVEYSKKVTIEEFRVECLGDGKFWTKFSYNDNWMRESIMEHLNGFLAQHIWPEANQILKRSFQDAVNSTNVSAFLPHKNYDADNLPQRTKPGDKFMTCPDVIKKYPKIIDNLESMEVVDFKDVVPLMKSETLRRNLDSALKKNSHSYLNHLWSLARIRVAKELGPGHPPPKRIAFYPERLGGEQEAVLELYDGWFKPFPSGDIPYLYVRDTAYGKNSSFMILFAEDVDKFEMEQNFSLQIPDERVNGSIFMSAGGIRNLVTVKFFILSNQFEIVDFDIYCINQTLASISGLPDDYQGLKVAIMAEAMKKSFIPLYKEYFAEMLDAFDNAFKAHKDEVPFLPEYIVDKHLFGVAVYHDIDEERQIKRNQIAIQCNLEEEPDIFELTQFPPFIGTDAEWLFFSKNLANTMDALKTDLDFSSLRYILIHELDSVKISGLSGEVKSMDSHEVKVPTKYVARNGTMEYSFKSTTPVKVYYDKEANEMILLAYLNFKDTIKLRYNILVSSVVGDENGVIYGTVQDLIYSYRVHINMNKKHFRLQSLHLKCVKGINMKITGISNISPQLEEHVLNSIRKTFMTSTMDDLEKFLTIALLDRVMELNGEDNRSYYLPEWNYNKDYTVMLDSGIDEEFNICPTKMNFYKGPDGLIYYSE